MRNENKTSKRYIVPSISPLSHLSSGSLARSRFLQRRVPLLLDARSRLLRVEAETGDFFPFADWAPDQLLELRPDRVHLVDVVWMAALVEFVDFKILDYAFAVFGKGLIAVPPLVRPAPFAFPGHDRFHLPI